MFDLSSDKMITSHSTEADVLCI